MLVTPLQLANVYATFANGGTVYQPNIVSKVLRYGGDLNKPEDVLRTIEPVVKGQVDLPPNVYDPILPGPARACPAPARPPAPSPGFDLNAFPIAGKTGTAQVDGKADTSIFAAFGPVGGPRYATAAILEESGFGANAAAPLVRHIFETVSGQAPSAITAIDSRRRRPMTLTRSPGAGVGPDRSRRDLSAPWRHLDPVLLVCALAIAGLGVLMVYSATRNGVGIGRSAGRNDHSFLIKQFGFVVIGVVVMVVTASIDYRKYRDWIIPIYTAHVPDAGAGRLAARLDHQGRAVALRAGRLPAAAVRGGQAGADPGPGLAVRGVEGRHRRAPARHGPRRGPAADGADHAAARPRHRPRLHRHHHRHLRGGRRAGPLPGRSSPWSG